MITDLGDLPGTVHGPHGTVHYLHALAHPQAICHARIEDEDRVPRACRWTGPVRLPDEWQAAEDDALQHLHDMDGRCNYCEGCRHGRA